jgi:hypothetical protein
LVSALVQFSLSADIPQLIDARGALQLAALSCLTTAIAMYKFLLDPEVSVRTALFADQAI